MNINRIREAKKCIQQVSEFMDMFQDNGVVQLPTDIKLSEVYKWDITDFIMYLIASDESINIDEVDVYRYLTGYGGDNLDSIKENIEKGDVMSYDFQSRIPNSLQYLVRGTNTMMRFDENSQISLVLELYLQSYMMAGKEIMESDDRVSYSEKRDYDLYISNLKAYIKEKSYVNLNGSLAQLLTDISELL